MSASLRWTTRVQEIGLVYNTSYIWDMLRIVHMVHGLLSLYVDADRLLMREGALEIW